MYDSIIVAGGASLRFNGETNKVFAKIRNKEVITYSVDFFLNDEKCDKIIIVSRRNEITKMKQLFDNPKIIIKSGGKTRMQSVEVGLLSSSNKYVLIHDAARPLLYKDDVEALLTSVVKYNAATLALRTDNTVAVSKDESFITDYIDRNLLASIVTPQAFLLSKIVYAHEKGEEEGMEFTDDSSIYNKYIGKVKLLYTNNPNIKITREKDLKIVEALLWE